MGASLLTVVKSIYYVLKQWRVFFARSDWLTQSVTILHYLLTHLQFLRASDAKLE